MLSFQFMEVTNSKYIFTSAHFIFAAILEMELASNAKYIIMQLKWRFNLATSQQNISISASQLIHSTIYLVWSNLFGPTANGELSLSGEEGNLIIGEQSNSAIATLEALHRV